MSSALQIFSLHIPDTVLAAICASILTLTGVFFTNRHSRVLLAMQLKSAALQSDRKREMDLRKEVYLPAAEAMVRLSTMIGKLSDLSKAEIDFTEELADNATALGKIHVVGSMDTVHATLNYLGAITTTFLAVMVERIPLRIRLGKIQVLQRLIEGEAAEVDRCIALMKQYNLAGNVDQRAWQVLGKQYEDSRARQAVHITEQARLNKVQMSEHLKFSEESCRALAETARLLPPALIAARAEMDLHVVEEEYTRLFNHHADLALQLSRSMQQRMRDALQKRDEAQPQSGA